MGAARTAPLDCRLLRDIAVPGAQVLVAETAAAADGLPAHCRVQGRIPQAIGFELRLPLDDWNGKFYMAGCGGFCGALEPDRPGTFNTLTHGLRRGYAAATTDGGHSGSSSVDGRWAENNLAAEIDWGWRAVAETTRVSRALVAAFYGTAPRRSYFAGCSTGGRMGLMAAQRFPADFDGIIAGAPALDYTGLVATQFAWLAQANSHPTDPEVLDRAKVPRIAAAVLEACDAIDGERDGLIADPRRCDWQPSRLACARGADTAQCLTSHEIAVLDHWYMPVTDGHGRVQYPGGLPKGSEPFWPVWLSGLPGRTEPAMIERFATDFLRYMAFVPDAGVTFEARRYDFDRDPPRLRTMSRIYDATGTDLGAFRARGGKLLVYHGWADPIVTPQRTLDWFADVRGRMGGREPPRSSRACTWSRASTTVASSRARGRRSVEFDPLPALEAWVERGEAPGGIDVRWQMNDGSVRSRKVDFE